MQMTGRLLVLLLAATGLACGGTSDPEPGPEPGASGGAETEVAAATPTRDGTLRVTRLSGSDSAPATSGTETTTATASVEGGAVVLSLDNFIHHCSPAPTFVLRMDGDLVVVQAEPPVGPGTRCIGPHTVRLRLEGLPAGEHSVSVRSQVGEEVATTRAVSP